MCALTPSAPLPTAQCLLLPSPSGRHRPSHSHTSMSPVSATRRRCAATTRPTCAPVPSCARCSPTSRSACCCAARRTRSPSPPSTSRRSGRPAGPAPRSPPPTTPSLSRSTGPTRRYSSSPRPRRRGGRRKQSDPAPNLAGRHDVFILNAHVPYST